MSKDMNSTNSTQANFSKVAIIILNWNGWKDTMECLESVFRIDYPNYQVIVVDIFAWR
jgi:GT2 family glycosyltransferase